jgi:hypothetical protein
MVVLKVVKSTQISVLAKGSSYEIHIFMKMIEQIVCYMLKVGHTGMNIADPQQHNVCGQLFPYRSGGGGGGGDFPPVGKEGRCRKKHLAISS